MNTELTANHKNYTIVVHHNDPTMDYQGYSYTLTDPKGKQVDSCGGFATSQDALDYAIGLVHTYKRRARRNSRRRVVFR